MRTTALPGPGFGVGIVWTVGGEEVEVRMRARWVSGRVSWAMLACLDCCFGGVQGCCSAWRCGFEGTEGARL